MARNKEIQKVLVIGSGPIVIGQAAEFDYAGTQACRVLKENGIEIVLVNSNPATIMTDNAMADHIYIEPLTLPTVKRIIEKERPDSILSSLGGQTGLTLSMQLAKEGFLEKHNVRLLGSSPATIDKAEDRQIFKDTMEAIGQPVIPSRVVEDVASAEAFARETGYPLIIRPAFTLGGSGGGIVHNEAQMREVARNGIALSPIGQILVEKCVSGWKEIEFEMMRDGAGNVIAICSMENFDPVGIHTGDSIVIAPAVTLADREYQMLRTAAMDIVNALAVEGGCNVQFALHPTSFEYAVIEVNPRVSRSSALASKATGYPIAKVATQIAIGYTLDEIKNAVTGTTYAAFEPAIDYVAVKFPKWPFDKFVYAKRELGTQMKATGEVMAIADTFEMALMKAVRGAEIGLDTLAMPRLSKLTDGEVEAALGSVTDERLFLLYEALKRGFTPAQLHEKTGVDRWFLSKMKILAAYEDSIRGKGLSSEGYTKGKQLGFPDAALHRLSGQALPAALSPVYKMVDTCAAEFAATTPYFYSIYDTPEQGGENEALSFLHRHGKETVLVLGSGPIRIGQGIEFDYASVHCVWALKKMGYEVIVINNNPETVSTDFDTADRLYFEPLTAEDVGHVVDMEQPVGAIVAFGGQTAIKLTGYLHQRGVPILGTSAESIDMCEDRERFDALLERLGVKRPAGHTVNNLEEALAAARSLEYPVLMRPSYVLGGQNMIIAFSDEDIREYMEIILRQKQDSPVLIDKYIIGKEIEVDAICDGQRILIPGIMEHIERTGVHSGDSIAVYPAMDIDDYLSEKIVRITRDICTALGILGLANLQYIVRDNEFYVIEVNPRASRTVPYLSKVTGVPMCELATRVSMGEKLSDLGYSDGLYPITPYTAVKVPVFSFEKLDNVDTMLGPEMKSTGEVLGIGKNLEEALHKGLIAAGYKMTKSGGVFITVRDTDKGEIPAIAKKFVDMGFSLYATGGTADTLRRSGLAVETVEKISENPARNSITLLESGKIQYIVSTSSRGRDPEKDGVKIRRKASLLGIPCLTALDTAGAVADSLRSRYSQRNMELVDINHLRKRKMTLHFTKMQSSGNDYIYVDNSESYLPLMAAPESLCVMLCDRHFGVGGDGVVLILGSREADARMRMFNYDGTEGEMGGNALGCVAKYLYDRGIVPKKRLRIETGSGVKDVTVRTRHGKVYTATINMGRAELNPAAVPVALAGDRVVNQSVEVAGGRYAITALSMGNPHCVVLMDQVDGLDLATLGPRFELDPLFPERINTEFVQVLDPQTLKMRVWERGIGETMACGTGACAAAVAAVENGYCEKDTDIRVLVPGGELIVSYNDQRVLMSIECDFVYEGDVIV